MSYSILDSKMVKRISNRLASIELLAREMVSGRDAEGEYSVLNHRNIMKDIAIKVGYKLDNFLMRSTIGDDWTMTSDRDFIELNIHFNKNGKLSVYALPMDDDSQETLAEMENIRLIGDEGFDRKKLIMVIKKVISNAKGDLLEHLRLESTF